MKTKYITTPIYYVNDSPHIGHAYSTLAADVLARYYRTKGDDVYLLMGTDEHGKKIAEAAILKSQNTNNKSPHSAKASRGRQIQNFTDRISQEFKDAWDLLNVNYDQFIRTTDPAHKKVVGEFLEKVKDAGYIYEGDYEGLYCVGCEEYKKEEDLENGNCPTHKKPVENVKESVWFFKLSQFQDRILQLIESDELKIFPEARKNEVLSFVKGGLDDIAISRSKVEWGIPLPWDTSQTVYVWVDALLNYYSAPIIAKKDLFPPDVQFMAKDILRFHGVIFPALLLAVGEKPTKQIVSHGFFTINGHKMSKSLGNTITPKELVDRFGVDGTRYLLLSQFPFGADGDFSLEKLEISYNAHLANDLGNLVQRVLVLCNKYNSRPIATDETNDPRVDKAIESFGFDSALKIIFDRVGDANVELDRKKPWSDEVAENDRKEILTDIYNQIQTIAALLTPFMPTTSQKILTQLKTFKPDPLFPRINP